MRGYFSSKISDNLSRTSENYLICHDVRLARTGWQSYSGEEWGDPSKAVVKVWRGPEEVFHPDTMDSLKGKTVTFHHPPQWVGPHNEGAYSRGVGLDPRRSSAADPDGTEYLIGDLMIKDANLISLVESGAAREVSLGYNFKPGRTADGQPSQTYLRVNHIAIVPKGRAGANVAIRDHAGKETKRKMPNFATIFGRGLKEFAKDEATTPDELVQLYLTQPRGARDADDEPKSKKKDDEDDEDDKPKSKDSKRGKDAKSKSAKDEDDEPTITANSGIEAKLDKLIALLTPAAAEAEDEGLIETETLKADEIPENPIPGADKALDALMLTKAAIAASGERKAIDGWNAAYRVLKPKTATKQATDAYKGLARQNPKNPADGTMTATDAAQKVRTDFEDAAKKYHRKAIAI